MAGPLLQLSGVSFTRHARLILRDISLAVSQGEFLAIIGPNGAGKSTLLNLMAGALKPHDGSIAFIGKDLSVWQRHELALRRAVLAQSTHLAFHYNVDETVRLSVPDRARRAAVEACCAKALAKVGLLGFGQRLTGELSGGEQQRVHLARVLVQLWSSECDGTQVLFLDEPVAGLDLKHQIEIMELVRDLVGPKLSVIAVMHDMNLALHFASRVVCIDDGTLACDGPPRNCLTPHFLRRVFGVTMSIAESSDGRQFLSPVFSVRTGTDKETARSALTFPQS